MNSFDAVERAFLKDARVYRIFADSDRLYFIHIGNILHVKPAAVESLAGLTPEQMLSRSTQSYSLARTDIVDPELSSSNFLLGHGLFWRFRTPNGKRRTFILHQWGDKTASATMLYWLFGKSLSTATVDELTRPMLRDALERAKRLSASAADQCVAASDAQGQDPQSATNGTAPRYQNERHSRTQIVGIILVIAVIVSALAKHGCHS